jgi:thiol-disulfide isomerase/thioredoxin
LDRMVTHLIVIVLLSLALSAPVFAASLSPVKGGKLPVISLPVPKDLCQKNYLGLSGEGFFRIPQIKANGVLIKIFNLYCPICQSTASVMAELYRQIEHNPDLKDKIKLIGIAAGNNLLEIEVFKQNYNIPFPIFPDEDFQIHQALGEVRTPFFIAIKMDGDGSHEVVHTHLGGLTDARAFLDLMVEAYGMKHEDLRIREAASSPNESRSGVKLK